MIGSEDGDASRDHVRVADRLDLLEAVPLRDLHAVPETAMREEVVILSLIPAPVAQQRALEVLVQPRRTQHRSFHERVVSEQNTGCRQRRVVRILRPQCRDRGLLAP